MDNSIEQQILKFLKKKGIIRPRDLKEINGTREHLRRLLSKGLIERPERGLYMLPQKDLGENQNLIEACVRIPRGVICLLTALRFHEITTQAPFEIWMAIPNKATTPRVKNLNLNIVRFSGKAMEEGVETHQIIGVTIRVYSPAKTVADCFKYRNKLGIDVAIESLRECWRAKKCSMDDLWKYAKICRVSKIIRPYIEMLS